MQVLWSEHTGLPTLISGPGFAAGRFDVSAEPFALVAELLGPANFLRLEEPSTELELVRDRRGAGTRTLVFQQVVKGVTVLGSRLVFTFDEQGRFIHFGGHYFPRDHIDAATRMVNCDDLMGTLDDQNAVITECKPVLAWSPKLSGVEAGWLVPVLQVESLSETMQPGTALYSEVTGAFIRLEDFDDPATRRVKRPVTPPDINYRDYMVNEDCTWDDIGQGPCNNSTYNRITEDLWYYMFIMGLWHQRYSYAGGCTPGSCPDYIAEVYHGARSVFWSFGPTYGVNQWYAGLDIHTRITAMTHEFSHGVLNSEVAGIELSINEGLADTYASLMGILYTGTSNHWCYHNYPGYWRQEECNPDHIEQSRCSMLSGDTAYAYPFENWLLSGSIPGPPLPFRAVSKGPYVEDALAGILYNVTNPAHAAYEAGGVYEKVFELFQVDRWINPSQGTTVSESCDYLGGVDNYGDGVPESADRPSGMAVDFYNGIPLSGAVSLYKTASLWYRFVTEHLSALGAEPHKTFGPNFLSAAWNAYLDGDITSTEYNKAFKSMYAVGHRQAPLVVTGHLGTSRRQAAVYRNGVVYLFYARASDNRIVYQKRDGTWTAPVVLTAADAVATTGLDAYTLPSGETRVLYRLHIEDQPGQVRYVRINADGTVPNQVFSYSCGLTSAFAPAGLYDGTNELVFTTNTSGNVLTTRIATCQTTTSTLLNVRGVSATRFQGSVYLVGKNTLGGSDIVNRQVVVRLNPSTFTFAHLSADPTGGDNDQGYVMCRKYQGGANWCYDHLQTGGQTPNLVGVSMPSGREAFARIYVGFVNHASDFKITRFNVEQVGSTFRPMQRTRILPVASGSLSTLDEVEFLQANGYLYVFEHNLMHIIRLYI
jgi:hypothetical protein